MVKNVSHIKFGNHALDKAVAHKPPAPPCPSINVVFIEYLCARHCAKRVTCTDGPCGGFCYRERGTGGPASRGFIPDLPFAHTLSHSPGTVHHH